MMQLNDKSKQLQSSGVHLKKKKLKKTVSTGVCCFPKVGFICSVIVTSLSVGFTPDCSALSLPLCVCSEFLSLLTKLRFFPSCLFVCLEGKKKGKQC